MPRAYQQLTEFYIFQSDKKATNLFIGLVATSIILLLPSGSQIAVTKRHVLQLNHHTSR